MFGVSAESICPERIIRNGDYTIVFWFDGEKTVVKREVGSDDSKYVAFCAALAKRVFGSTDSVIKVINDADDERIKNLVVKEVEAEKEAHRQEEARKQERAKKLRIKKLVQKMRDEEEAEKIYWGTF